MPTAKMSDQSSLSYGPISASYEPPPAPKPKSKETTASRLPEHERFRLRYIAQIYARKAQAILDWLEDKPIDSVHFEGELFRQDPYDSEVPIFDNPYSIYQPGIEATDPAYHMLECSACRWRFLPKDGCGEDHVGCPRCNRGRGHQVKVKDPTYRKVLNW